tara:strand:- start:55 stop:618 length:564 start_codon:yes stop_codon:yes gene_type:complete
MKLIVGLGNPGERYKQTRHNVGFMVLDKLIKQSTVEGWDKKFDSFFTKIIIAQKSMILLKPLTFMNVSGHAVQKVKNFYDIDPNNIVIIHDDIDLELGKIKLKKGGGDGGHNGLKSIIKLIGSEFNRIRIGIGRPEKISVSSYVLNNFREEEVPLLKKIILKSCEGINLLIANEDEECRRLFSKTIV